MTTYYVQGDNTLSEQLTDPSFDNDGDWVKGTGWTVSGGKATCSGAQTGNTQIREVLSLTENDTYRVSMEIEDYADAGAGENVFMVCQNVSSNAMFGAGVGDATSRYTMYLLAGAAFGTGVTVEADVSCSLASYSCKSITSAGTGTSADPWIGVYSIDWSALSSGDTLSINGDITMGEMVITGKSGLTIRMEDGVTWDRSAGNDAELIDHYMIYVDNCQNMRFENMRLRGNRDSWTAIQAARFKDNIYFHSDCTDCVVTGGWSSYALRRGVNIRPPTETYPSATGNEGIGIHGMNIHNNSSGGVGAHSLYGAVTRCRITSNGLVDHGDDNAITCQGGGTTINDNYFEGNGDATVKEDHEVSCDGGQDADANQGIGFTVARNYFKDSKHSCLGLYNGAENSTVIGNVFDGWNTAALDSLPDTRYTAVLIGRTDAAEGTATEQNITIHNNFFTANGGAQASGSGIAYGLEAGHDYSNLSIKNNTFYEFGVSPNGGRYVSDNGLGTQTNVTIDYNLYYQSDGDYTNMWRYDGGAADDNFAAWQSSGYDTNGLNVDPQALSATDFRLNGSSPCIEAGTRWWGTDPPPTGQDGLRFSSKPAIGAYQPRPDDGATRSPLVLSAAAGVYDAGVDIAKVRAA